MAYFQIIIPRESAWFILNQLGRMNQIELADMTPEEAQMSRPFFPMIRRIEDVLGRLAHIEQEMLNYRIKNIKCKDVAVFLQELQNSPINDQSEDRFFESIEHELEEKYGTLQERLKNLELLKSRKNELFEHIAALQRAKSIFDNKIPAPQEAR